MRIPGATGRARAARVLAGAGLAAALAGAGCGADPPAATPARVEPAALGRPSKYGLPTSSRWAYGASFERRDLTPVANTNPHPEPQPHRDHPYGVAVTADGARVYVTLLGNEAEPGREVAVFDVRRREVSKRIEVGAGPGHVSLTPSGRHAVVLNRYSNYASVIDTQLDEVVGEIELDFYCTDLVFDPSGARAYVSNRYLDQILVLEVEETPAGFSARVAPLGGLDEPAFADGAEAGGGIHALLRDGCGSARCHAQTKGGFYAGEDATKAYLSAVENARPGDADESLLLRAVLPVEEGGFADDLAGSNFHAGGLAVWSRSDPAYRAVAEWIERGRPGPGIAVGNFGSKPGPLALSGDGRLLYAGNQGTQDISVVDVRRREEVTAIYTQNVTTDLALAPDPQGGDVLVALSLGAGFGAAKERDPYGGETTDREHPLAQFSVYRDIHTTEPLPLEQQDVLGPFDAIDGTAAFKMSDIQNDVIAVRTRYLEPPAPENGQLRYALLANRYEAHDAWVRYTSDSAEILPQDISGDIPPSLQRVVGAFPESLEVQGDRLFVAMQGSSELVEWRIDTGTGEASELLEPVAVYPTGLMPREVAVGPPGTPAEGLVFVSNFLGETLSVVDTRARTSTEYVVGDLSRPFPDSDAERGELFVNTCLFSVDQDTACASCHIYGLSDGRGWGAGQAIAQMRDGKFVNGGLLGIPQLRNLFAVQPFYFEGTHTAFDGQFDDAREHVALQGFTAPNPHGDFTGISHPLPLDRRPEEHEEIQDKMSTELWGPFYHDLLERRDELTRRLSMRYFGKAFDFRDLQRFIGEFQAAEIRLVPNPFDARNPSVVRGRLLFNDLAIGCVTCHAPPHFTNKSEALYHNRERVLPSLISFTGREKAFTLVGPHWMDRVNGFRRDLEYWEEGRVERVQGMVTTFSLRGLFDRPFAFLHHGRALSVREAIATPDHYSLRRFRYAPLRGGERVRPSDRERGFNELSFLEERTYMVDTHGATSHLNARQMQDLENFLLAVE